MSYLNLYNIREEIVVFLRNSDIFTTTVRGVTTVTEEFDGDDNATDFAVTQATIKNVRSVTVGGVAQSFGTDYTVNYSTKTVSFTTAPATGTDNVDIQYDYGTDKIFPDFPRPDLTISSFPRIGVDLIGVSSEPGGFGNVNASDIDFMVVVYAATTKDISNYITTIRQKFIDAQKSFYYMNDVRPLRIGPIINNPTEKTKDKIEQQNIDFRSYLNYEIN